MLKLFVMTGPIDEYRKVSQTYLYPKSSISR